MQKIIYTSQLINRTAKKILSKVPLKSVLCFNGPMGSGKTTLIKALVEQLGGVKQGSSPSFGIVNEYHYPNGQVLGYHFDFYRLKNISEALDLGFEDYLNQGTWIFVEWPEMVTGLLPDDRIDFELKIINPMTRELTIQD